MPASRKVTTEAVLQAAEEVLREKGFSAVNARNVAEKLGCSTQPIYLCFENMDQLRQALTRRAVEAHTQRVRSFLQAPQDPDHPYRRYSDYGMGFVQFARQEKQLFRWLYLEGDKQKPRQQDVLLPEILETIVQEYGYDLDTARRLHQDMTYFSYGLAILANTDQLSLEGDQLRRAFQREFMALTGVYGKPPRNPYAKKEEPACN